MILSANGIIGADVKHMEGLLPKNYGADVVEIPGARDLLDSVVRAAVPWAIVTSGTTPLVTGWLDVLKFPLPEHLVVAEDVENGKPDPQCYLMGKEKLALEDGEGEVLVLEDSPAGIAAGKAAGCKVLAVVTSHTVACCEAGLDRERSQERQGGETFRGWGRIGDPRRIEKRVIGIFRHLDQVERVLKHIELSLEDCGP